MTQCYEHKGHVGVAQGVRALHTSVLMAGGL